ncbi:hypothetical protein GCM10025772_27490 [Ferrimonas gelatinilytica]|uniref:DUF998 domain-containing protein n=2 Tax=Ferrimonas gelatinilytica TaxID=1255257 RepID=A0ABP9SFH2_9GAMM
MPALSIHTLGYVTALLPLLTTHLCWGLSILLGYIEPCNPYGVDCVSISNTGRHGVAYFLFKAGMLPTTLLLFLFWGLCWQWLALLGQGRHRAWLLVALLGSAALMLYALTLGHSTGYYPVLRRNGIALFLFMTFTLQVVVADGLYRTERWHGAGLGLLWLSTLTLVVALLSVALAAWLGEGYERLENGFEWWLLLLLNLPMLVLARLWQLSGLKMGLRLQE